MTLHEPSFELVARSCPREQRTPVETTTPQDRTREGRIARLAKARRLSSGRKGSRNRSLRPTSARIHRSSSEAERHDPSRTPILRSL